MTVDVEYTSRGIQVREVILDGPYMAGWFEHFEPDYFRDYDLVSPEELDLALEEQREAILQNLPEINLNYHDDEGHPGTIRWCDNLTCRYATAAKEIKTW